MGSILTGSILMDSILWVLYYGFYIDGFNIDQQSPPVSVSLMVRSIFDDLVPRVDQMMVKSTSELLGVKFGRDR
jgi:hypothetical protein